MNTLRNWRERARVLRRDVLALDLVRRDPRVPWYVKVLLFALVAYALSPIDLVPDFIPVFGHLDDVVLIPLGIALAVKMVPADVLDEYRREVESMCLSGAPRRRAGIVIVFALWLLALAWLAAAWKIFAPEISRQVDFTTWKFFQSF